MSQGSPICADCEQLRFRQPEPNTRWWGYFCGAARQFIRDNPHHYRCPMNTETFSFHGYNYPLKFCHCSKGYKAQCSGFRPVGVGQSKWAARWALLQHFQRQYKEPDHD